MSVTGVEPDAGAAGSRGGVDGGSVTHSAAVCLLTVVAAQIFVAAGVPVVGAALDALLLFAIVQIFVLGEASEQRAMGALALVPLLSLLTLSMAVDSPLVSLALAGLPLSVAVVLLVRTLKLHVRIRPADLCRRAQWGPAAVALPLGLLAAVGFHPAPLIADRSPAALVISALVVFAFAGVLEEVVFRGVLQESFTGFGSPVLDANVLFTATYLATGSPIAVVAAAVGGGLCGWWVRRTGSVTGVAVAHGVAAVSYLVIGPLLIG